LRAEPKDIDIHAAQPLSMIRTSLAETKARLATEIASLGRRGNLNLVIGIFTTLMAATLLGFFVLLADDVDYSDVASVLKYYVPRISFVAFIEVFSFFFLRLYKASLDGIKYFQNEMTNVELRFISIELALLREFPEPLKTVIANLSGTERNFILKTGESTVELRKAELDQNGQKELLALVVDLVGKTTKTKS
jgi:hypothetical protein